MSTYKNNLRTESAAHHLKCDAGQEEGWIPMGMSHVFVLPDTQVKRDADLEEGLVLAGSCRHHYN